MVEDYDLDRREAHAQQWAHPTRTNRPGGLAVREPFASEPHNRFGFKNNRPTAGRCRTRQSPRKPVGVFRRAIFFRFPFPGNHSEAVTPVPIPNTEVKGLYGEGTAGVARGRVARCQDFSSGG